MPILLRKFTLSFLVFLTLFVSFAPNFLLAKAAATPTPAPVGTWYNSSFGDWWGKVYDPTNQSEIFGERYTAAQVQWVIYSLFAFIINSATNGQALRCVMSTSIDVGQCLKDLGTSQTQVQPVAQVNTVEDKRTLLQMVFAERPMSGIGYVKGALSKLKLVPEAHAQTVGFGFRQLEVVRPMWVATRNFAYALFIIATVIFSFMIMFRVKISPQVVVSVQSALPKLIGALILVTFSYAIAGFLIDLMYIVYGIISLFGSKLVPYLPISPSGLFQFLTAGRIGGGVVGVDTGIFGLLALYLAILPFAFGFVLFTTLGVLPSLIIAAIGIPVGGAIAAILAPITGILLIVGVIIFIIFIVLLFWAILKIFWALLKAFATILFLTILAPIQIVAGVVIPSFSFGNWVKSYVSALAIFVVTSVLIFFAFLFMLIGTQAAVSLVGGSTSNPLADIVASIFQLMIGTGLTSVVISIGTPSPWPPLLNGTIGGGTTGIVGLLFLGVSFVIFTLIPKATQIIQSLLSGKPFAYGTAIGEAFGPVGLMYGASGAKETVDMTRRAFRQGQLESFFNNWDKQGGLIGDALKSLKRLPGVGPAVTRTMTNVKEGITHSH